MQERPRRLPPELGLGSAILRHDCPNLRLPVAISIPRQRGKETNLDATILQELGIKRHNGSTGADCQFGKTGNQMVQAVSNEHRLPRLRILLIPSHRHNSTLDQSTGCRNSYG